MEKLVAELKKRGYKLVAVKHHSQQGFEIDEPGKGSWRFAVATISRSTWACRSSVRTMCEGW